MAQNTFEPFKGTLSFGGLKLHDTYLLVLLNLFLCRSLYASVIWYYVCYNFIVHWNFRIKCILRWTNCFISLYIWPSLPPSQHKQSSDYGKQTRRRKKLFERIKLGNVINIIILFQFLAHFPHFPPKNQNFHTALPPCPLSFSQWCWLNQISSCSMNVGKKQPEEGPITKPSYIPGFFPSSPLKNRENAHLVSFSRTC